MAQPTIRYPKAVGLSLSSHSDGFMDIMRVPMNERGQPIQMDGPSLPLR